jgi:phospholipid/cholesterol/gamma-HCH transport system substrate-binding protein
MTQLKQKNTSLKVGLTIFSGLVVLLIFTVLVGTNDFLFSKTYNLYINLDNTAGLVNGAPVTLGGYKIGDVGAVEFVAVNNKTNIRIKLRIKDQYKNQIREDSKVRITSIGILGEKFVDISIGNPSSKPVAENSYLEVESSLSLDNLANSVTPGLKNFNKTMENIKIITDSISKGQGTIGRLVNNSSTVDGLNKIINKMDLVLNNLDNKNGSFQKLVNDSELYNNLTASSNGLKNIVNNLNIGKGSLGKLLINDSLYNNLTGATEGIKQLLQKTQSDSTVIGGLVNDKKMYTSLSLLVNELAILVKDLKEHPGKYINLSVF